MDPVLGGTNGSKTFDRGSDGAVIPAVRNVAPAINGATLRLTLDPTSSGSSRVRSTPPRPLPGPSGSRRSSPTPRRVRCWRWPTTRPSTRRGRFPAARRQSRQPCGDHPVRAGVGEQDHHRGGSDRVRRDPARDHTPGARLHPDGRCDREGRVGARHGAVHHGRNLRQIVERRHPDAGAQGR